jgi:hypothetical protein
VSLAHATVEPVDLSLYDGLLEGKEAFDEGGRGGLLEGKEAFDEGGRGGR